SANTTVTQRRSSLGTLGRASAPGVAGSLAFSPTPQWPQKRLAGGFSAPHPGQAGASRVPHCPQNR
ncbi:MAG TPA: hypothetical protein VNA30_01245, partial [Mycobacteriales bacterium]|nr:hypothetical protein [Mycobacteriales bacterium]